MKHRIENLFKSVSLLSSDGYLISNESNVTYLSGFTGEAAYLLLAEKGQVLMTDGRYDSQASDECDNFEEAVSNWDDIKYIDGITTVYQSEEKS